MIFALANDELAETVKNAKVAALPVTLPVALKLPAAKFPVTVTAPNVVVPPLAVVLNVDHALALVSPSVGHTFNVEALISYHN